MRFYECMTIKFMICLSVQLHAWVLDALMSLGLNHTC